MSTRPLMAPWRLRLRFGFRNGRLTAAWGLLILLAWLVLAVFAPWIAPYDPIAQNTDFSLLAPSLAHPFGTDNYGRDILSRVIWGARIDLQLAIVGVIFPFMIGTFVGAVSGYIGGRFDSFCMRVIDVILAFPFLVLMLAIMAILGTRTPLALSIASPPIAAATLCCAPSPGSRRCWMPCPMDAVSIRAARRSARCAPSCCLKARAWPATIRWEATHEPATDQGS